ncbi:Rpn family recombination-promoting nuclease/putative transposase [Aerosakkonemataceae cyanobacterium BLCC-F50]|uniref:Rpn family recombination-promoting nuclease/putative transposase n=1 Tax=Floridaenema flaviceps BLCC-F50 TaxID=3153642 RepID=A0ABV4Y483_9CYAN
MAYDNLCKYLAETYASNFVRWLLDINPTNVRVLKTEIIPEPIRSDALILLQTDNQILHLEFQTLPYSEPPLPYRMLKYWVLLYGQYNCDIEQVVIFLKETTSEQVFVNRFERQNTQHSYRIIRLWEQDPTPFLAEPALLPLAPLTRSNNPTNLLEQVAQQVAMLEEPAQKQSLAAAAEIIAGLRFEKSLIRRLFREELMQESVIYQDILERGLQRGLQRGEAIALLRILTRRFGEIPLELAEKIRSLPIPQLEALIDAQIDFSSLDDLVNWLEQQS